jgi:hypothetical protein
MCQRRAFPKARYVLSIVSELLSSGTPAVFNPGNVFGNGIYNPKSSNNSSV